MALPNSTSILTILESLRPEFKFDGVDDFFERGLLDSFDLTSLVSALEEQFGVAFDGSDIVPENFQNVDTILSLLAKRRGVK